MSAAAIPLAAAPTAVVVGTVADVLTAAVVSGVIVGFAGLGYALNGATRAADRISGARSPVEGVTEELEAL